MDFIISYIVIYLVVGWIIAFVADMLYAKAGFQGCEYPRVIIAWPALLIAISLIGVVKVLEWAGLR